MTEASPIPPPRSDDDEDVHWALSTASALWARGDTGEALKWLRRAAETASDQNRDQRSLELFKAAADATSLLGRGSGSVPAPPGHGAGSQPAHGIASSPPPGASASHPPPRTSGTPPPPRAATPPPPRVSATPPPPRVSAAPPSASTPPPIGSAAPPPRVSATPPPPQVGAARPSALPSASTPRPPGALPAPVAAARAVLKGKEATSQRPSGAVARKRKNTLDERFQFPDDEVTLQRDVRSLDRSRPAVQPPAPPADDAGIVSAMAPTAPVPATGASGGPASGRGGSAASRTTGGAGSRAQPTSGLRGATSSGPSSSGTAASGSAASGAPSSGAAGGAVHTTTTRTILSAGTSARPSGVQPAGSAAAAAARAMSRQPTRKIDTTPPPMDDLDEQTSVLSGDEAELDFDGSATGENPVEDPRTVHDEPPDAAPSDAGREATPEPTPGASATDEPLYAPSIRPQPMGEVAAIATSAPVGAAAWPTMRVALRRDAGGVRIEALGIHAATPPGAIAALLVAHDPASAEALAKLLEPR